MSKSTIDVLVRRDDSSLNPAGADPRQPGMKSVDHGWYYVPRYRYLFGYSFLIVDDVPASCKLLALLLKEFGAVGEQLHIAYNLRDAEFILDSYTIDFVFSDLNLGTASGLQLLERIRMNPRTADVPFVLVTNSPDIRRIDEAFVKGASSVLTKPLSIASVAQRLDEALGPTVVHPEVAR